MFEDTVGCEGEEGELQEREAAAFSQEAEMNAGVQLLCSLLILGA